MSIAVDTIRHAYRQEMKAIFKHYAWGNAKERDRAREIFRETRKAFKSVAVIMKLIEIPKHSVCR